MKHHRETTRTSAERKLATVLRTRKLKFIQNHFIEDYEVDFWFPDYQLAVEIDGYYHLSENQSEMDRRKDRLLMEKGILLIRFTNQQIHANLGQCVQDIKSLMAKITALKSHHPVNEDWKAVLKTIHFSSPKPVPKGVGQRTTQSVEDYFLSIDDDPDKI